MARPSQNSITEGVVMSIEYKIIAARPDGAAYNKQFLESVRSKIIHKRMYQVRLLFRRNPAVALLAFIVAVSLISGTTYAVTLLWPQLEQSISEPQKSASGRVSVVVANCDKPDTTKRYELKNGAPVASDRLNDVVKAKCELNAISEWSDKAFSEARPKSEPTNKPGAVVKRSYITPAMFANQLMRINQNSLTIADSATGAERDIAISADTTVIANGQYVQPTDLAPGDSIAYVSRNIVTTQNRYDCMNEKCDAEIVSTIENVLSVIKLKYEADIYRAVPYLTALAMCAGNPADECPELSSVDVYQRLDGNPDMEWADISGKVVNYNDQAITITTTSGREVTVRTPWNIIGRFNAEKSSGYGMTIDAGDTLWVTYGQTAGQTNSTDIPWERLIWVRLLVEPLSKAGPYPKY